MKKLVTIFLLITIVTVSQARNRHLASKNDTIPKHYIELKVGAGIDYIISLNGHVGLYVMLFSNDKTRISIDNVGGVFVPGLLFIRYYYPSIRYQRNIKNIWFGCTYGVELSKVTDLLDEPG